MQSYLGTLEGQKGATQVSESDITFDPGEMECL